MKISVNGSQREVPAGATVASVVESLTGTVDGVAVALNDTVVRRSAWQTTPVREADRLEVLTASQGG
jgi:sulfur carrier protein